MQQVILITQVDLEQMNQEDDTQDAEMLQHSTSAPRKRMRIDSDDECDEAIPFKIRKVSEILIGG